MEHGIDLAKAAVQDRWSTAVLQQRGSAKHLGERAVEFLSNRPAGGRKHSQSAVLPLRLPIPSQFVRGIGKAKWVESKITRKRLVTNSHCGNGRWGGWHLGLERHCFLHHHASALDAERLHAVEGDD